MTMNPRGTMQLEACKCWNIRPLGRNPAHLSSLSGHVRSGVYTRSSMHICAYEIQCHNTGAAMTDRACAQNHTLNPGGLVQDELRPLHDEGEGAMRPECPMRGLTHLVVFVFSHGGDGSGRVGGGGRVRNTVNQILSPHLLEIFRIRIWSSVLPRSF